MGNLSKGYITIGRQLLDHWLWQMPTKYDERSAWIYLILHANYKDLSATDRRGLPCKVLRGQLLTSTRKLASDWGWSLAKTLRYTKRLANDNMIRRDMETFNGTLITIVNYDKFQTPQNTLRNENGTLRVTQMEHGRELSKLKELKVTQEKKERGATVSPSERELPTRPVGDEEEEEYSMMTEWKDDDE